MAVDTANLSKPVLQAIETWGTDQNHSLGYETQDRTTGKRYRYVKYGLAAGGLGVCYAGTPVGAPITSADITYTANNVSADASLCASVPIGVSRGSATTTNCYGFIELCDRSLPTTVIVTSGAVVAGDMLKWSADGMLLVEVGASTTTTQVAASIVAFAVDSHIASYAQGSVTLIDSTTAGTPVHVVWR